MKLNSHSKFTHALLFLWFFALTTILTGFPMTGAVADTIDIHDFTPTFGPKHPSYPPVMGADGNLYGVAQQYLYKIDPSGNVSIVKAFDSTIGYPDTGVVIDNAGNIYGTANGSTGNGLIFELSTSGTFSVIYNFDGLTARFPQSLVVGSDGNLYGTASGGSNGFGANGLIFEVTPAGAFSQIYALNTGSDSAAPSGLVQGSDGAFYGRTYQYSTQGYGLFRVTAAGAFSLLYNYTAADGTMWDTQLTPDTDGTLYGATSNEFFRLSTNGTFTVLGSIAPGDLPSGGAFSRGPDGNFYGTNYSGSATAGTILKFTPDGSSYTIAYTFHNSDGSQPSITLSTGRDGNVYGATNAGGANFLGSIFKIASTGIQPAIASFGPYDGGNPSIPLTLGSDGYLYGVTQGYNAVSTIFKVSVNGAFTTLQDLGDPQYGEYQSASSPVVQNSDGNLYYASNSTVYQLTPTGTFSQFSSVAPAGFSSFSVNNLTQGPTGTLYGLGGGLVGTSWYSAVFQVLPNSTSQIIATFPGYAGHGSLLVAGDGTIYGETTSGGNNGYGSLFSISTNGTYNLLYSFTNTPLDGNQPYGTLVQAPNGDIYGTTEFGGPASDGNVFQLSPDGSITYIYSFSGNDGSIPQGALVLGVDGNLYGTTSSGGTYNAGTVYELTPAGQLTTLQAFTNTAPSGYQPQGGLTLANDGNLYGPDMSGGVNNYGTIYRVTGTTLPATLSTTSISPSQATPQAQDLTITVNGTDFTPTSTVQFVGTALATTFVSSTQLTAIIPGSLLISSMSGPYPISVTDSSTGAISNAQTFTLLPQPNPIAGILISPSPIVSNTASYGTISLARPLAATDGPVTISTDDPDTVCDIYEQPAVGDQTVYFWIYTWETVPTTIHVTASLNGSTFTVPLPLAPPGNPVTTLSLSGPQGNNGFYTGTVVATLSATDSTSTISTTYYSVDNGSLQTYSQPFTIPSDGYHSIEYWSTDTSGASEAQNWQYFNIDQTPPVTTASVSGTQGSTSGLYTSAVTITLSPTDNLSGVAGAYYTIDGGAKQTYTQPFTVSGDGSHTVKYWSVDAAGNAETTKSLTFTIDTAPPTTTATVSGVAGSNGWWHGLVTVTLTAIDAGTGVSKTYYEVDGGAQQTYSSPIQFLYEGRHTITFWSVDNALNIETPKSQSINIDETKPTLAFGTLTPAPNAAGWNNTPVSVPYTTTDALSGVATATPANPATISTEGSHVAINIVVTDVAGNVLVAQSPFVNVDLTAPKTLPNVSGTRSASGAYTTPLTIALQASDTLSGVAATYYTVDGGAQQTYTSAFTVTGSSAHTVQYWSVDVAGNVEAKNTLAFSIDTTAPVTTATLSGPKGPNGVFNGTVTVTLSAIDPDGTNDVAATYYTINGGGTNTYTGPFTVANATYNTVVFWSVDTSANTEAHKSISFQIDETAPVTTASLSGPLGLNGWYTGAVTVTLSATDPDGTNDVASTFYTIDGGAQQTYAAPFQVSGDAKHTVAFWSTDQSGNVETAKSQTIKIDGTPPVITLGAYPAPNAAGWNNSTVNLTYIATDPTSGPASITPSGPTTFTAEGVNQTTTFTATDFAGNSSSATSTGVNIDLTAPVTTATPSGSVGTNGSYTTAVTVALAGTDNLSGVASTYYTVDSGAQQTYSAGFPVTGDGSHTVNFWSVDKAGNVETKKTLTVAIDSGVPVTTASLAGTGGSNGWFTSAVTVTLSATDPDGASDVAATYYKIDSGTQQTYTAAFGVTGDGTHTVTFSSVDKAGNTETTKSQSIKIDTTKPTVAFGALSPAPNAAGWNHGTVTVAYTAADATSGVATATPGSPLTFASAGNNQTQTVTATDNAGNSTAVVSPTVKIDLTAPSTTANVSGAQVTLTATDALSGVASTYYKIDSGTQTTYSAAFTVTGVGSHTVTYWSVDVAGNVETSHTATITITPVPTASSLTPSSAYAAGAAFTLTVTGTNFASSSSVTWNGTALATTYVSTTSLTATVPASDIAAVGTATIKVVNPAPGGGTSSGLTFTIKTNPAPTVSTISPTSAVAGTGAFTLTITGTNFVPTSVVKANGTFIATTYVSTTSLTATVPASTIATAGTVSVTVANPAPGGGTSAAKSLTVAAATISALSLNPTSVKGTASSTVTVTLTGPAPTGGFAVTLTSSSTKATLSTSTLTIAAGSTTGTFTVNTVKVTANTTSTITAKNGSTSKTATLTITP